MARILITILILIVTVQNTFSQCSDRFQDIETDSFILHRNLQFGENTSENGEHMTLLLDVYEPIVQPRHPRPMVIMVHGGSFTGGSKEMGEVTWFCEDLAKRGIVTASISYRVESNPISLISQEKMVKAVVRAVEDVKASIRYFHKHIEEGNEWNIDPEAIILGGTSAGSIANLHSAFMDEYSSLNPEFKTWILDLGIDTIGMHGNSGNPGYSEAIAGLINISGAIVNVDFLNNNSDLPIVSFHNAIDLSVPYAYGYPYFIPTLPIVAGSRPIHFRMDALGGTSKLMTFQSINHIPHTDFDGDPLQPAYDKTLNEILRFVADNSECNELATPVQDNLQLNVQFYPNPAKDRLVIKGIDNIDQFNLELVAIDGSIIQSGFSSSNGIIRLPGHIQAMAICMLKGRHEASGKHFTQPLILQ
ncbi:MAG: alpha/beta hydrolase [Bacteroidetes bacterium]|nr:alpha/beta hydrolase [Bacteroidota bacterium]